MSNILSAIIVFFCISPAFQMHFQPDLSNITSDVFVFRQLFRCISNDTAIFDALSGKR